MKFRIRVSGQHGVRLKCCAFIDCRAGRSIEVSLTAARPQFLHVRALPDPEQPAGKQTEDIEAIEDRRRLAATETWVVPPLLSVRRVLICPAVTSVISKTTVYEKI